MPAAPAFALDAFGRARRERYVNEHGQTRQRMRRLPQAELGALIWGHHRGYIDKTTFERNREPDRR
jgi:hypothetical protein